MNKANIRWNTVGREDLLDVLLGEHRPQGLSASSFPLLESKEGQLALGYPEAAAFESYSPPSLVVINDDVVADTLSWLRVYAGEASPISQFARVVLASDWQTFGEGTGSLRLEDGRSDRWACVTVGEAMAQTDGDADFHNMPLSRLTSCLSMPVGRSSLLFGQGDSTRICVDRLRAVASDSRFGRRAVSVDELAPVWAIAGSHMPEHVPAEDAALLVMEAASRHFQTAAPNARLFSANQLRGFPGLSSDSVEERVVAFNRLSLEILQENSSQVDGVVGPVLAAAAFLVGRSTSHAFLLKRVARVSPVASVWFGAMAALAGPRAWDATWLRAVKGAERLLRAEFSWLNAPSADICWAEFAWLAGKFGDLDQLISLPKMLPRTLSIEVVPGTILQVRFGAGTVEPDTRTTNSATIRERALQDALAQFVSLAQRVKGLVDKGPVAASGQQSLNLGSESSTYFKARPKKRRDVGDT
jgi:hypothetical protein